MMKLCLTHFQFAPALIQLKRCKVRYGITHSRNDLRLMLTLGALEFGVVRFTLRDEFS